MRSVEGWGGGFEGAGGGEGGGGSRSDLPGLLPASSVDVEGEAHADAELLFRPRTREEKVSKPE